MPLLVGVNGRAALAHAVHHADIVAPTMLGRTREDGHHHDVRWEASRLDGTVDWMRHAAADAGTRSSCTRSSRRLSSPTTVGPPPPPSPGAPGSSLEDVLSTPFLCIGTHAEIVRHLVECRERWGFSYFSVRDIDAFTPVIEHLRLVDADLDADLDAGAGAGAGAVS